MLAVSIEWVRALCASNCDAPTGRSGSRARLSIKCLANRPSCDHLLPSAPSSGTSRQKERVNNVSTCAPCVSSVLSCVSRNPELLPRISAGRTCVHVKSCHTP
jgi:hypothetical protein